MVVTGISCTFQPDVSLDRVGQLGSAGIWLRSYLVFVQSQDPGAVRLVQQRAMARWAVERWADFPVDEDPRPLVFTGPVVLPERGFRTGEAKIAFLRGKIEVQGPVPDKVLATLCDAGSLERHPGPVVGPLVLTGAKKSEMKFSTDRGPRVLPAWSFEGDELLGVLLVLDPEVVAMQWRPVEPPLQPAPTPRHFHRSFRSQIEPDDYTLHFEFTGSPPEWVDYPSSEVTESDHAVAVIPVELDHGPPGPRIAIGYRREVVVPLRQRFGNRVLVNLDAKPVSVLT